VKVAVGNRGVFVEIEVEVAVGNNVFVGVKVGIDDGVAVLDWRS
jgi:hypothetical protein